MALNPFQQEISNLARSLGLRGSAETQVYQRPEFAQLVNRFFGAIPLPAGIEESMVRSRSAGGLTYLDPQGYEHILERNLNAVDPRLGQVSERSTNRPAILPLEKTNAAAPNQQMQQSLVNNLVGILTNQGNPAATTNQLTPVDQQFFGLPYVNPNGSIGGLNTSTNASLPQQAQPFNFEEFVNRISSLRPGFINQGFDQFGPNNGRDLLSQIANAENLANQQLFDRQRGTAVAQLVGSGVGASSIAGDIMNQLLQGQGLVNAQAQSNQATRDLQLRELFTGIQENRSQQLQQFIQGIIGQGVQNQQFNQQLSQQDRQFNAQNLQEFVTQLLGLGTQRDIASAGNETNRMQIGNQDEQFYKGLQEQIRQFDEQLRMQERQNLLNNIFKGVAAGTSIATGIGGLFNSDATTSIPAPPIPKYFPSTTYTSAFGGR